MEPRFSLLTFPQRFDGARLHLRILLVPRLSVEWNGDPLLPVPADVPAPGSTAVPFADADLQFEVRVQDGLDRFPADSAVSFSRPLPAAGGVVADARALFEELVAPGPGRFVLSGGTPVLAGEPREEPIRKYLPRSYRESFLFTGPRTDGAVTDGSYHCAIKEEKKPNPFFVTTPSTVSWGQIYAYCLRHHQLARRLGLVREASFALDPGQLAEGGFLYVDLAAGSDYAAEAAVDFGYLKRYAARIPPLVAGEARPLFAAVQLPVLFDDPAVPGPPAAPGNYDAVLLEAADYADGFAKVVHAAQPVSQNLLEEEADGFAPLTDVGIRLGWDDEQILIRQNRQLRADPTVPKIAGKPQRLDAPMGVFGYRIDARLQGDEGDPWHALGRVRSRAPLALGDIPLGEPAAAPWEGELGVEVHPQQLDGDPAGPFWLPAYLAQWNGKSVVLPDEDAAAIFKTENADGKAASLGRMYEPVGLEEIPLRYGRTYELRVRLMDATGGGPAAEDEPVTGSAARVRFRRHVVPEPPRVPGRPKFPDAEADAFFAGDTLTVRRPLLGYPAVVFTGKYAAPVPLLVAAAEAAVGKESSGIPDPDVTKVRIDVEVRALRMDNRLSLSGREAWAHLYTTHRDLPADFADLEGELDIPLEFRDAPVLDFGEPRDLTPLGVTRDELDAMAGLVLPTARDLRLTVRAVADEDPGYFAGGAHVGKPIQIKVRRESAVETGLFAPATPGRRIRGLYLQPDPVIPFDGALATLFFERAIGDGPAIIERLAGELGTDHKGLTLVGRRGERVVFGCSRRIRHTLAPDNSSLTFAAKEDLSNHWLVAITLRLDRDWTWDGLRTVSFEIFREKRFRADAEVDDNGGRPIGDWEVVPTASLQALDHPRRDHTTLIFLDAVEPKSSLPQVGNPAETRFPDVIVLDYRVETRFLDAPAAEPFEPLHLELPVTTPPAQIPRLASAGLALSEYRRNETYSATEPRRRFLWLELEEPVRDPNDACFIRLLAAAPDPLLSDNRVETLVPPEEPPLAIDPEWVRVITPGQPDDEAGLPAMTRLLPSLGSDRHFLVPLPPGLHDASPELFGLFTYELRIGHAGIWSTAQGRFGRPLRCTGVQHPAPPLFCTCLRDETGLVVEAPFARAVHAGKNVTADPPRTGLWALLYAQVRQADGKDWRNVLLEDRELLPRPRLRGRVVDAAGKLLHADAFQNRDAPAQGTVRWAQEEIADLLAELGLPPDAPISVLCVETLPTLEALRVKEVPDSRAQPHLATALHDVRSGNPAAAGAPPGAGRPRPLSDSLGHHRILRTSPLTEVPAVCCPTC